VSIYNDSLYFLNQYFTTDQTYPSLMPMVNLS